MKYANFLSRSLAYILDLIIVELVIALLVIIGTEVLEKDLANSIYGFTLFILNIFSAYLYFSALESSRWQTTIGKKVFGLRVVDKNGQKISFNQASRRYLGKLVSSFLLYLGYIIMFFNKEKQTLHDYIAETFVVIEGKNHRFAQKHRISFSNSSFSKFIKKFVELLSDKLIILILLGAFSNSLVAYRAIFLKDPQFESMYWNVTLAWIPLILALLIYFVNGLKLRFRKWFSIILFIAWFFFLPNTLYLLTDYIHLREVPDAFVWFDIIMLQSYTIVGFLTATYSLSLIKDFLDEVTNEKIATLFIIIYIPLANFGVYLGRFLRLNSWEVLSQPTILINQFLEHFKDIDNILNSISFVLLYSVPYALIYMLIRSSFRMENKDLKKPTDLNVSD